MNRNLFAGQIRARRSGIDPTIKDRYLVKRYAGLSDRLSEPNEEILWGVVNRLIRQIDDIDEFDLRWPHEREKAEAWRREQEEEERRQQAEAERRRHELASRPRKPCPYCGRITPREVCRQCDSGCDSCGRITSLRDTIGRPRCESCERKFTISHTRAKKELGATDEQLDRLPFVERVNPYHRSGPPMRLYNLDAVKEALRTAR